MKNLIIYLFIALAVIFLFNAYVSLFALDIQGFLFSGFFGLLCSIVASNLPLFLNSKNQ